MVNSTEEVQLNKKLSEYEVNQLIMRGGFMEDERRSWEDDCNEIMPYVFPRHSDWSNDGERLERPGKANQSGEPISSLQQLADGMQGYTASRPIRWQELSLEEDELMELPGVADYLEIMETVTYAMLNRSNFYESLSEAYKDAPSCGLGTIYSQELIKNRTVRFTPIFPAEIYISEGDDGTIDTTMRKNWRTLKSLYLRFGEKNLHTSIRDQIYRNPFRKIECRHFVFPHEQRRLMGLKEEFKSNFPWVSIYLDVGNKHVMSVGGYYENPYHHWRWSKNSGELYPRSPALDGRAEILMINRMSDTTLRAAQLSVQPPLNIPDSLKGDVELVPFGFNYYTDPNAIIKPIQLSQQYPIGVEREEALAQTIYKRFYADFFLMLQHLEKTMTAREVIERQGEKAAILGNIIGRLYNEFLDPLIRRTIAIAFRAGYLPEPPAALREYGGNLKINFMGPLAQIQKSYYQSQGVSRGLQAAFPFFQLDPKTVDNFDLDAGARDAAESSGMPQKIIIDIQERDRRRAAKAQAQQEAMQQKKKDEMLMEVLKNFDKLNKPTEEGSAIDALGQYLSAPVVTGAA